MSKRLHLLLENQTRLEKKPVFRPVFRPVFGLFTVQRLIICPLRNATGAEPYSSKRFSARTKMQPLRNRVVVRFHKVAAGLKNATEMQR